MSINLDDYFPEPKRDDGADAKQWRGALFWKFSSPLLWKGTEYFETIEPPNSVTFPICALCHHVIWCWPHFEETVPPNAICDECAKEENANE